MRKKPRTHTKPAVKRRAVSKGLPQRADIAHLPRITLSDRELFDLDQILVGAFAPLRGFLNKDDYESVVSDMRLANGAIWPMPITLGLPENHPHKVGDQVILADHFGNPIATMQIESIYAPDKKNEARGVYGTESTDHPGVRYLFAEAKPLYAGGTVTLIERAPIHDFRELRRTPEELKKEFKKRGWKKVVAFQTRNPIHRAHFEIIRRAAKAVGAKALIHPVVGLTKEGDIDYVSRVRAYKRLVEKRLKDTTMLSLLPIAMRMAGPREAIWHALIRKNYGATHFIVGRDHAGPGADRTGKSLYDPYAAQELAKKHEKELGIGIIPVMEMAYLARGDRYVAADELKPGQTTMTISGTQFRAMLREGKDVPEWFSFPEVVEELRIAMQKEKRRGAVIFLTGLSGAGKSTIAHVLYHKLLESFDRSVTLLDGDIVREHLSKGLGFSKEDRNANIERIGFVASEIAKHGGIAICAAIAPYAEPREKNRSLVSKNGTYIEVHVATPLSVCEKRDRKGLYKKARAGLLKGFTGVDDPYEAPENPELSLDTSKITTDVAVDRILGVLKTKGII